MKKAVLLSSLLVFIVMAQSCDQNKIAASAVPQAVITTFNSKYSGSTDLEWEKRTKDGKTMYESEFKMNGKKMEAEFDEMGNFLKEE